MLLINPIAPFHPGIDQLLVVSDFGSIDLRSVGWREVIFETSAEDGMSLVVDQLLSVDSVGEYDEEEEGRRTFKGHVFDETDNDFTIPRQFDERRYLLVIQSCAPSQPNSQPRRVALTFDHHDIKLDD